MALPIIASFESCSKVQIGICVLVFNAELEQAPRPCWHGQVSLPTHLSLIHPILQVGKLRLKEVGQLSLEFMTGR